jgi:hypothetical protein
MNMNMKHRFGSFALAACAMALAGCASVKSTRSLGVIDTMPESASKGYVEFHARQPRGPISVYEVDQNRNEHLLGAVGLKKGDKYYVRDGMTTAETLRIAAAPGKRTFALQKNGPQLQVDVEPDKVTRVELDYEPIDPGDNFVVYKVDYAVAAPVAASEAMGSAPRSE